VGLLLRRRWRRRLLLLLVQLHLWCLPGCHRRLLELLMVMQIRGWHVAKGILRLLQLRLRVLLGLDLAEVTEIVVLLPRRLHLGWWRLTKVCKLLLRLQCRRMHLHLHLLLLLLLGRVLIKVAKVVPLLRHLHLCRRLIKVGDEPATRATGTHGWWLHLLLVEIRKPPLI
jgi:hypothetical protein